MRYFLPDWDDRVHRNYDFIKEKPKNEKSKKDHSFIWDIYSPEKMPIDGLLISRANLLTQSNNLNKRGLAFQELGIREYYRFPENFPIMCDCGAFSYIMEKIPPYDPLETLDFYSNFDFDFGVSVDHLIVPATMNQKEDRYRITLDNAKVMFEEWHSNEYRKKFKLIGVVQGWNEKTYSNMTEELLEIGYDYIAIGGVARASNKEIVPIVSAVKKTVDKFLERNNRKRVDIHVFGVGRENLFRTYLENGITSFDSASFLRSAWLSDYRGYHLDFNYYTPIRVKLKKNESEEKLILKELRERKNKSTEELITLLKRYDNITDCNIREESYIKTLNSKCWKKCPCNICKKLGIEVTIFRGNNRNRRRGFHNVWNYYFNKFIKFLPKISVILEVDNFRKGVVYQSVDKSILSQIIDLPIEIFVTNGDKILHISEDSDQLFNTKLESQLIRSEWIFSNTKAYKTKTKRIKFTNSNIRQKINSKIIKIYNELIDSKNLLKLEGSNELQKSLTSFLDNL